MRGPSSPAGPRIDRKPAKDRRSVGLKQFGVASFVVLASLAAAPAASASPSALALSPKVVAVGKLAVGSISKVSVVLTNSGAERLTVDSYEAFGDNGNFLVKPRSCGLGTNLRRGEACTFVVRTSPTTRGSIRGHFCITGVGHKSFDRECGRVVGVAR
jgi:hypothetical protein